MRASKNINSTIVVMDSFQATMAKKPKYNGFKCGHGVHGDTKYNRRKSKRAFERELASL